MGISYGSSVEDQISILAVLSHKAVAGAFNFLAANIQSWLSCASNELTAVKIPVMEEVTFFLFAVVLEKVASLLDLTNLLAQRHRVLNIWDGICLYLFIYGWITFPNCEVLAVIRNISKNVFRRN